MDMEREKTMMLAEEFESNINEFQSYIDQITLRRSNLEIDDRRVKIIESVKFEQFYAKIRSIFRQDLNEYYSKVFYKKICIDPDTPYEWSDLFGYAEEDNVDPDEEEEKPKKKTNEKGKENNKPGEKSGGDEKQEKASSRTELLLSEVQIFMASLKFKVGEASGDKARRDIIQNIQYAPDIDSFIVIAQKGAVTIYNNKFKIQGCVVLKEQSDGWLNGCCFLPNVKRVVITAERSITFWDYKNTKKNSSNNNQMNMISIQGLSNLTCIDSVTKQNTHKECDKLIFGDNMGNIMTLEVNINDLASNNTVPDLVDPTKKVIELERLKNSFVKKHVHDEAVTKVIYVPEMSSFISCSISDKISLVIEDLHKFETKDLKYNRQVGIPKGVNAVCYCVKASLIATAGADKSIRLFNPLILSKSCVKLAGHVFTIVDLACNEKDQQLISLSAERLFRVWDLATFKCLQVFSDTENRPGENRIYCITFDQKRERLLSCSSVIDCWPLSRSINDSTTQIPRTHDRAITSICYAANQIATLCAESTLKVWEADTGRFLYYIKEANGPSVEVVAMTVDPNGYKLATAGSNGSIKIWNFGTGQEMKSRSNKKQLNENEFKILSIKYEKIKSELYLFVYDSLRVKIMMDSSESNELVLIKVLTNSIESLSRERNRLSRYGRVPSIGSPSQLRDGSLTEMSMNDMDDEAESPSPLVKFTEEQLNVFKSHKVNTIYYSAEKEWLLTGNHEVIVWNTEKNFTLDNIIYVPSQKKAVVEANKKAGLSKITDIRVLLKKEKPPEAPEPDKGNSKYYVSTSIGSINQTEKVEKPVEEEPVAQAPIEGEEKENVPAVVEAFFNYMIVTSHTDSVIRFWNENNQIIAEIAPVASIKGSPITSICIDTDLDYLYTGDVNGYITIWSYHDFLFRYNLNEEINLEENFRLFKLVVCWRAHMSRIVRLILIPESKLLFSGSPDESVRVWWGHKSKFIGFLGQKKPFTIPSKDVYEFGPPIDITEASIFVNKIKSDKKMEKNYEYPLILDKQKLSDKNRPASKSKGMSMTSIVAPPIRSESAQKAMKLPTINKRYFNALVKPKHENLNASDPSRSWLIAEGSIFSSLPLYEETASIDPSDFKALLAANPYRLNKEVSYIMPERVQKKLTFLQF